MKRSFERFLRERIQKIAEQEYETPPSSTRKIAGPENNPDATRNADEIGGAKADPFKGVKPMARGERTADSENNISKSSDDSHLISFASKPGQMFRASGAAPKDVESHDVEGSNLKFSGPKPDNSADLNAKNIKDAPSQMPGMKAGRKGYYGKETQFVKFVPNDADDDPKTGMKKPGASGIKDDPSYMPPEYKNPAYGDKSSTPKYKTPIRPDGVTGDMEKAVRKSPKLSQGAFDNLPSDADAPGAGTEHTPTPSRAAATRVGSQGNTVRTPGANRGLAVNDAIKAVKARRTNSYLEEEVNPAANVNKGFIGVNDDAARDNINIHLAGATACAMITPYIALEKVRKVLAAFHIFLPKVMFLEGEHGVETWPTNQFGEVMGIKDNGEVSSKVPDPYHIYFEYQMNDRGMFDIFCEIVNEDELHDLLDDVESELDDDASDDRDAKLD